MKREELERVGYIVMNSEQNSDESYTYHHIYKVKPDLDNCPNERFDSELDSEGIKSNGWCNKYFRLATPKEIEMYKQAGEPVDVTMYKMEKVVKMVKCISINFGSLHKAVRIGQIYKMDGAKIILDNGNFICNYGSLVANNCFRLCQEREVEYVECIKSVTINYTLGKIYEVDNNYVKNEHGGKITNLSCTDTFNNKGKKFPGNSDFEPSTKEAFERQIAGEKGEAINVEMTVHYENIQNKIVEIPIRKKNKRKVKMEILKSPRIKES